MSAETFKDYRGRIIRLTPERRDHIAEHPEMTSLLHLIDEVVESPELVRRSRSDEAVHLFYRYLAETAFGGKWLCIVVGRFKH